MNKKCFLNRSFIVPSYTLYPQFNFGIILVVFFLGFYFSGNRKVNRFSKTNSLWPSLTVLPPGYNVGASQLDLVSCIIRRIHIIKLQVHKYILFYNIDLNLLDLTSLIPQSTPNLSRLMLEPASALICPNRDSIGSWVNLRGTHTLELFLT